MVKQLVVMNHDVPLNADVVRAVLEAHGIEVEDPIDVALSTPGTVVGYQTVKNGPFVPFYIRLEKYWTNTAGSPMWPLGDGNDKAIEKMIREDKDVKIIFDASVEVW